MKGPQLQRRPGQDNKSPETSGTGCSATWPRDHRDGPLVEDAADYFLLT
jgi:hypothetical protein